MNSSDGRARRRRPESDELLDTRCAGARRAPGGTDTICERYALFGTQFVQTLSEAQWHGLVTIFAGEFSGKLFEDLAWADHGLSEQVRAAHEAKTAEEWDYDSRGVVSSLAEWSEEVLLGVAEVVDRFWASDLNAARSPRQRLLDCGAKISP